MKRMILILLALSMLLAGCDSGGKNPTDPREGLVEHYYDGLYFYLGEELKQVASQDGSAAFESDTMKLNVQSLWLEEFDSGITSSADFAAAYADLIDDSVQDVQVYQANGVWYDIVSMNGYTLVCGFYVQGEYGWMVGIVTEVFQNYEDDIIRYVTLGKIKEGFVPKGKPSVTYYRAGDEMFDLSVTVDGQAYTVAEILKEKKLVVLNFWFADCGWCVKEFPVMEVAYQQYRDSVEILALNPTDDTDRIAAFQQEHSLSFPMASCNRDTALAFGITGYPTSVFIDREGMICLVHSGAVTDTTVFYDLFAYFTAEDYESRVLNSITDLP